jgi:hypothetical protein
MGPASCITERHPDGAGSVTKLGRRAWLCCADLCRLRRALRRAAFLGISIARSLPAALPLPSVPCRQCSLRKRLLFSPAATLQGAAE